MTQEQALLVVRKAAEAAQLNKEAHVLVEQALTLLAEAIKPKEKSGE